MKRKQQKEREARIRKSPLPFFFSLLLFFSFSLFSSSPRNAVADWFHLWPGTADQAGIRPENKLKQKVEDLAETLRRVNERTGRLPCRVKRNKDGSFSYDREENIGQAGYRGSGIRVDLPEISCRRYTRGPAPRFVLRILASRDDFRGSSFSWLDLPEAEGGSRLIYTPLMNGGETLADIESKGAVVSLDDLARANGIAARPFYERLLATERASIASLRRWKSPPKAKLHRAL